jgi:CBS domain containing-hemolysin-like protein
MPDDPASQLSAPSRQSFPELAPRKSDQEDRKEGPMSVPSSPQEGEIETPSADKESSDNPAFLQKILSHFSGRFAGQNWRTDLQDALEDDQNGRTHFSPEERAMLRNILHMREVRLDHIMIPRADIIAVDSQIPLHALLATFKESGHSRMPVYEETLDNPLGMVHIKDLVTFMITTPEPENGLSSAEKEGPSPASENIVHLNTRDLDRPLKDLNVLRNLLFVPPSMPASDLLATMQATRIQMALVIDEYGGTDGLVSLEDIVETVVGDIEDEHDENNGPLIRSFGQNVYVADARLSLEDLSSKLGPDFDVNEYVEDVDTLGGLIFELLDRVPTRGELISSLPPFEFEILDADPRRIKRIKISRILHKNPALLTPPDTAAKAKASS